MDKYAVPPTYIRNSDRAHQIAKAELPFRETQYVLITILSHCEELLDEIESITNKTNELDNLLLPITYEYLLDLFEGDDFSSRDAVRIIVSNVFAHYKKDYHYADDVVVPAIPIAYIMMRFMQYNSVAKKQMTAESALAERRYTATMN